MRYTYGYGDTAARRLGLIAGVFDPHSSEFISSQIQGRAIASAIDLGCGPGFTTRMLALASGAGSVHGLDVSESFIREARQRFANLAFLRHDVTRTPFPAASELMYCRFLLSHLPDPSGLVETWAKQLPAGGLLIAEEIEDIETDVAVFRRYLSVNRGLVSSQGADLYAGARLAREVSGGVVLSESFALPVANRDAAAMFHPNTLSIWEHEEYVRQHVAAAQRREISRELEAMIQNDDRCGCIVWKMRRLVIRSG